MSRIKRYLEEIEERGFEPIGDKFVCSACFTDRALQNFIIENAQKRQCNYCHSSSRKRIAAPIDTVIEHILESLETEWADPNDELGWEGGWVGEAFDTYELLWEIEFPTEKEELLDDIISTLSDRQWCLKDYYSLRPHEQLLYGWNKFSDTVKYQTRYVFLKSDDADDEDRFDEIIHPAKMLEELDHVIWQINLVRTLPAGMDVYRVRVDEPGIHFSTAEELGPPPPEKAKFSNRMSPAGIPMFYGAFDELTAVAETYNKDGLKSGSIGIFQLLKNIKVIDLTKVPEVPSLFDAEHRHLRSAIQFITEFVKDITRPVEKDGREHIEYVPTQIVTEYFRRIFRDQEGDTVKGILYPSSKQRTGTACVLFFDNQQCCDWLASGDYGDIKYLALKRDAVKIIALPIKS